MKFVDPTLILLTLAACVYGFALLHVLRVGRSKEWPVRLLMATLLVSLAWTGSQILYHLQKLGLIRTYDLFTLERIRVYGLVVLAWLVYFQTRAFQRRQFSGWLVPAGAGASLLVGFLLFEGFFSLPQSFVLPPGILIGRWQLAYTLLVLSWAILLFPTIWNTLGNYRKLQGPLHRNRNQYWSGAIILAVAGQGLVFAWQPLLGHCLQLLSVLIITYATLTYSFPDLRLAARQGASILIMALLSVVLYTAVFYSAHFIFQSNQGSSPVTAGIMLSLAIIALLNPLLGQTRRLVNQLVSGNRYDAGRTLREYSMNISSLLDLKALSATAVSLIGSAMDISHGTLITVTEDTEAYESVILRLVESDGEEQSVGKLPVNSPWVKYLRHEHHPLTQYDIDLQPRFHDLAPSEREWLTALRMDIFVPIYAHGRWRGLLALGPKTSGDRFYAEDLSLLQTLADQTAVALENARLYDDLQQRNTENERLNYDLTHANAELARLDQAKSDFISIASHELRTPLTQIIGYNDMVADMFIENAVDLDAGQAMTESVRGAARRLEEIVDTMFEVSKLDTNTLEMMCAPVSLAPVVAIAVEKWITGMEERKISLQVRGLADLPSLWADSRRLTQVFTHLIQNAIKNTPDGGTICITGRVLEEGSRDYGGRQETVVEVIIADTGVGIPIEELDRIFEKFYRVGDVLLHSSGSTKFQGAGPGLGLTIARGIIEAHGGANWAESTGRDDQNFPGASFHILLPVKDIEEQFSQQELKFLSSATMKIPDLETVLIFLLGG